MVNIIDIHKLELSELNGVVSMYPWYAAARMELCRRLAEVDALSEAQLDATALYLGSRTLLSRLAEAELKPDCADKDIKQALEKVIASREEPVKPVHHAGGDYFSQEEYEQVRRTDDNVFSRFASKARAEGYNETYEAGADEFCTETLAKIYLEQDCKEQAINIYSKLSLRYPEKSVYFAALIDEINKKTN